MTLVSFLHMALSDFRCLFGKSQLLPLTERKDHVLNYPWEKKCLEEFVFDGLEEKFQSLGPALHPGSKN